MKRHMDGCLCVTCIFNVRICLSQYSNYNLIAVMEKLNMVNKFFIFMIPLVISMSSFVMGYFMVYFTMMEEYLQKLHNYTAEESELYFTLTMALLPLGAFIASFFYVKFLDVYGENKVLRMMDVLAVLAIVLQFISMQTAVLSVSRFLMGFYCGITTGIVPSYILSLSPSFTSGIVGTYNQVAVTLGMAFAFYMGQLLDSNSFSEITAVRLLIGFPLICLFVHIVVLFLHPFDNIQRHIMRRENNMVRSYLKTVYGANWKNFESEIRQYKIIPIENQSPTKSTRDIYQEENFEQNKKCCKCNKLNFVLLAIMLAVANQLSGISVVLQYAKQLFLTIQEGDEDEADISVMALGFFQVLITFSSGFFINRFGRRPMMLTGMAVFTVALLVGFFVTQFMESHEKITVIVVFVHVLGYSLSLGPICMMYAVQALEKLTLVLILNWGLYSVITLAGDYLIQSIGLPVMFLIFGISSLLSLWFFYFYMVETMNTPRKKVWQNIQGIKIDWQKSFNILSEISLKKKANENKEGDKKEDQAPDKTRGTI